MRQLTCDPNVEVIGAAMLSILENLRVEETRPLLEKYNLTAIEPQQWYPAQRWLSAMNEMASAPDVTSNFVAIGMEVAENVILPPELENATLPQILGRWNDIYQMQHRGGDIGHVAVEAVDDQQFRTIHRHIYPDDMVYGLAYGWCRRFLPPGTPFAVQYEELDNRMDQGNNDQTVVLVTWE